MCILSPQLAFVQIRFVLSVRERQWGDRKISCSTGKCWSLDGEEMFDSGGYSSAASRLVVLAHSFIPSSWHARLSLSLPVVYRRIGACIALTTPARDGLVNIWHAVRLIWVLVRRARSGITRRLDHRLVKMYIAPARVSHEDRSRRKYLNFRLLMSPAYGNGTLISLRHVRAPVDHPHASELTLIFGSEAARLWH